MADIKQAAKWMQEGKRVCRPDWHTNLSCSSTGHLILYSDGQRYELYIFDLLADDWEIAE